MTPRAAGRAALSILLVAAALLGLTLLGLTLGGAETASADGTLTADSVAITSDPGPDNEYHAGDTITATVTFSAPITSHANAALTLNIGSDAPILTIPAATVTPPANTLDFSYVVSHDVQDTAGITVPGTMAGNYRHAGHSDSAPAHNIMALANALTTPQAGHLVNVNTIDYDTDGDGLIEIDSLAKLNAVRWDANGSGEPDLVTYTVAYAAAFPKRSHFQGCPDTADADSDPGPCVGYELTANLDFDTGAAGVRTDDAYYGASGHGWVPIPSYSGRLVGNGHTIANLYINLPTTAANPERVGLFGTLASTGSIRGLGVTNASITRHRSGISAAGTLVGHNSGTITGGWGTGAVSTSHTTTAAVTRGTGGLVGMNLGTITASWASASARAVGTSTSGQGGLGGNAGGLVGHNSGTITASYATGDAHATGDFPNVGGLIGYMPAGNGRISYSYTIGRVTGSGTSPYIGGLVGRSQVVAASVANNYWGVNAPAYNLGFGQGRNNTGKSTAAALQGPTGYTGIYASWNIDLDGVTGGDDPWNFGTSSQYPVLHYGGNTLEAQGRSGNFTDYDRDDDGLIDIDSLVKLDAIRHDLDGDGGKALHADYAAAFPNRNTAEPGRMGCPEGVCVGYELARDLDFDDGVAGNRADDTYYKGGVGWAPIIANVNTTSEVGYSGVFEGNGYAIANLYINLTGSANTTPNRVGLFGRLEGTTGEIRGLGITNASVTRTGPGGEIRAGALVGRNLGTITACYATGAVSASDATTGASNYSAAGGLVGINSSAGTIRASYAAVAVAAASTGATGTARTFAGGLAGLNWGTITAVYASGAASAATTSSSADEYAGGLVGANWNSGASITASYATGGVAGAGSGSKNLGGLAGNTVNSTITNSYWNTGNGRSTSYGSNTGGTFNNVVGKTTAELQNPTTYVGIYSGWNVNLDSVGGGDDPWNFGSSSEYPVLHYGGHTLTAQGRGAPTDYDMDNDGLVEVRSLAQLDAIRHDLEGDGNASHGNYAAAFPNRNSVAAGRMGCPDGCTGYELMADLDFASDAAYANWAPIGHNTSNQYLGIFQGNGHTIANLTIDTNSRRIVGLFGATGTASSVAGVGLTDVDIRVAVAGGSDSLYVGGLMGLNYGAVRDSYVTGAIATSNATTGNWSTTSYVGGLIGFSVSGTAISNCYAAVDATARWEQQGVGLPRGNIGGLVGFHNGYGARPSSITASYATGSLSGVGVESPTTGNAIEQASVGGLVGHIHKVAITASYAAGAVSAAGNRAEAGGLIGRMDDATAVIQASYATGSVSATGNSARAGGLIGYMYGTDELPNRREIRASYATGAVSAAGENALAGGLVAAVSNFAGTVSGSYWDTGGTGQESSALGEGRSASALQNPTGYQGIYAIWNDHDLDGDGRADAPWDFGDSCQYPALEFGGLRPARQRGNDPPCPSEEYVAPPIVYNLNIRFSVKGLTLDEGESGAYRVRMTQAPAGHPAKVSITSNNPDVVVSPTELTFSSADYNQWQTVKVTTLRDANDTDESASLAHRGPNLSYGAIIVAVNDTWPGAATETVNGHTVTMRHTLDAPYGVTATAPDTLDVDTDITIAGPPSDTPDGAPGYGLGATAAARLLAEIRVRGTPADGLDICLPAPAALVTEAGAHPLTLLRYAGGAWTRVAGAERRDGDDGAALLCADGVTEYGVFAAAYALPELGAVSDLAATAGEAAGTITLTWTPGANAEVHWVAGVKQSDPYNLAVWGATEAMGSHTAGGLEAGETYIFTVTAGRGEGDGSQWAAWAPWVYAAPAAAANATGSPAAQ